MPNHRSTGRTKKTALAADTDKAGQIPAEFLERLGQIIPNAHLSSVLASFATEKAIAFRINTLADSRDSIIDEMLQLGIPLEPVDWFEDEHGAPLAFKTPAIHRKTLTHSDSINEGKIYLQNVSSMLAPWVLDPRPGETVLDLAAAPGGKTTQLAQQMRNAGVLSAVESVRSRMYKLQANLKRCHVEIAKTYLTDGRTVGQKTPERFDRVLLDAPCSSEARFQADDPASWSTWSLRKLRETARKQMGLLKAAIHATKIGGEVLYCTCSFAPEENEQVVDKVLKKFSTAIELIPFEMPVSNVIPGLVQFADKEFNAQVVHCRRVLPNDFMDGFFMAKFRKLNRTA